MPLRTVRLVVAYAIGSLCAACVVTAFAQQQLAQRQPTSPTTAPAKTSLGTVAGRVTAQANQRLPEMVMYLEPTDPKVTFPRRSETIVVSQKNATFSPGLLVVPVNTRVRFDNDEDKPVEHNVFSMSEAKKFDLGLYKPGEAVEPVEFDTPGAVRIRCSIHRYMDGVVYVTPTPFFAIVGKDGTFTIDGVKPGMYRLKTWQRSQRFREREIPVSVWAGKMSPVTVEMSRK